MSSVEKQALSSDVAVCSARSKLACHQTMYIIPRKAWLLFNHVWPLLAERALSARHVYIESVVEIYLDAATASISTTFDATLLFHQLYLNNLLLNQQLPSSCLRSSSAPSKEVSPTPMCISIQNMVLCSKEARNGFMLKNDDNVDMCSFCLSKPTKNVSRTVYLFKTRSFVQKGQ